MSYAVITTKIDPQIKKEAMDIADSLGLSLNAVIKSLLNQFVRAKRLDIDQEKPNNYLLKSIRQSEKEIEKGDIISFQNKQEMLDYLNTEIKNDQPNQTAN